MTRRSGAGRCSACRRGSGAGSGRRRAPRPRPRSAASYYARVEAGAGGVLQLDQRLGVAELRAALGGQRAPGVRHRDDPRGHRRHGAAQAGRAAAAVPPLADVAGLPARAARVAQRLAGVGDRVAGVGAAGEGELGDAREMAALRAAQPEVQRERVRVAARRGQRVEPRRPGACARRRSARSAAAPRSARRAPARGRRARATGSW